MSLPSPEQLEAVGYLQLPPQGDYGGPDVPLASFQMALRLRIAEGKLAAVAEHCRKRLEAAIVQGPVSDLCRDILAIIGTKEEDGDVR